ncbi:CvfB family protein [Plebeiibacterium marinum]|uniref:S1-like domain-containing RNA-binding protein n=1 Tax=Plebeiibacterium marinum TaxID=2992111 RepID=A0AAE3MHA3_9BACT|nr:S1-like domain-containing RNA-binding protein [Plebeiobacterium marinum]MCW3807701.1 S1-like domain-containing RNA-binding protein [Plebeiobacterium marinum]
MAQIGKYNNLKVVKDLEFGLYLDGGELGEILLPRRYVPINCTVDDELEVFIYLDSEDRLIATTEMPEAIVGEFAYLKAVEVGKVGAFMDWGLPKDLLVPFREQKVDIEKGRSYVVYVYLDDESRRIAASSKVEKYLDNLPPEYEEGQEVDLLIYNQSELGYKAIINNTHSGMIYANEVFKKLRRGDRVKGYIKKVREDDKIDLMLEKAGYGKVDDIASSVLDKLKKNNGFLPVTDKSPAEEITGQFGISKKNFKKAIGSLYKQRIISIDPDGIRLIK